MTAKRRDTVRIRAVTEDDIPALAAMSKEFQDYLSPLLNPGDGVEPSALTEDALYRHGCGDDRWFRGILAERDGAAVGYLLYYFGFSAVSAAGALVIADLFVREADRSQGVGKALMTEAARLLRQRGGKVILWTVWDRNPAAIGFYQRMGATTISDELFMVWPSEAWPSTS